MLPLRQCRSAAVTAARSTRLTRFTTNKTIAHKSQSFRSITGGHGRSILTQPTRQQLSLAELGKISLLPLVQGYASSATMSNYTFPPPPPMPTPTTGEVKLVLPATETRPHKYFALPNGLEAIVVSDDKADKASAAMNVGVGHLSDPEDLPGCAHFCEHLMFLGTKKYPKENAYSEFLSANNGHSNAWTAMTDTNYYFDVSAEALEGALERFSGFFTEPLFAADCTERECNAVNSEHKKNLQQDMWRQFQLSKHLSKPGHVYRKFGTGDLETLWTKPKEAGKDPREELIKWWDREYCARRMKLVVVGKQDLATLESWVRERFESVPVKIGEDRELVGPDGLRTVFAESPIPGSRYMTATFVKTIKDSRGLEVVFPFPDLNHMHDTKPANFLAHYLGHEGKGSLLSYLKKQGWCNSLRSGPGFGANGFDFFRTVVDLTADGLDHYDEVALAVLNYVNLLKSQPPSKSTFDEIKALSEMSFRFTERGQPADYANSLAEAMQQPVDREKIVSAHALYGDFNEQELRAAFDLLDPTKVVLTVTGQQLPKSVEGTYDLKEPIYGTEYKIKELGKDFRQKALTAPPLKDFQLPGANPFIPENVEVEKKDVEIPATKPSLIRDSPLSRLWHKQDDRFFLPKSSVQIVLYNPLGYATPRTAVMGSLLMDLFADSIVEDVYDAEMADLHFHAQWSGEAYLLSVSGYSDKMPLLLEDMTRKLKVFKPTQERFEKLVDRSLRSWRNKAKANPYQLASYWSQYVSDEVMWTYDEKVAEIADITLEDVHTFGVEYLKRLHVETLIHGNMDAKAALKLQDVVEDILKPRALTATEKRSPRSLLLPQGSDHVWVVDLPNKAEVNHCVDYFVHVGDVADAALRAKLALFAQIASEPTFNVLRTQEQLGYITQSMPKHGTGLMGFRVLVQSERDPIFVETRIESFLSGLKQTLEEMDDVAFEKHKQSVIESREQKVQNMNEEARRFWARIGDRYYDFERRQTDIKNFRTITKQDILDLYTTHVEPSSNKRAKLSVHMRSQYKGVKFDSTAAAPLIGAFGANNVAVDMAALGELMQKAPTLVQVKDFAKAALGKAEGLEADMRAELESMIDALEGSGEVSEADKAELRPANVFIKDITEFKATMLPSKGALPVEPLSLAKL